MNPPYTGNLHISIMSCVVDKFYEACINLSPVRWLQDPLAIHKKNSDWARFTSVRELVHSVDVISAKDFQILFNAIGNFDLGIYDIRTEKSTKIVNLINPVIARMSEYNYSNPAPLEQDKYLGIRVRIPLITAGKSGGKGMEKHNVLNTLGKLYLFVDGYKDGKQWWKHYNANQFTKKSVIMGVSICFDTENEAQNFVDSFNTIIGKFYMGFAITDVHVNNQNVLWMHDYTEPWTDERFRKFFNITDDEWNIIVHTMKHNI